MTFVVDIVCSGWPYPAHPVASITAISLPVNLSSQWCDDDMTIRTQKFENSIVFIIPQTKFIKFVN
jgi:hypothetical protein